MQTLVYIFIVLAGLGVAAAAYFGFTFTPIEAFVTALTFCTICIVVLERALRQRSEARLERAIGDLQRLLSTDAQAGATLSQRVNALSDENSGRRLDGLEADVSVLGTVVRQVAEAVAELEAQGALAKPAAVPKPEEDDDKFPEPVIPLESLREALDAGRLVCHIQPIIRLPQRKPYGYTMVPRLRLDDGEFADPPDFMPRHGGVEMVRRIEAVAAAEAVGIARRYRSESLQTVLHVPLSRATLTEDGATRVLLDSLENNQGLGQYLAFEVTQAEFRALGPRDRGTLAAIAESGAGLSISAATSLRLDYGELQGINVRTICIDANGFAHRPESFTDFHAADIAAYARRYGIELVGVGVLDEQQVLRLFEDGITLAQGPYLGAAAPARPDQQPRRAVAGVASRRIGA